MFPGTAFAVERLRGIAAVVGPTKLVAIAFELPVSNHASINYAAVDQLIAPAVVLTNT